MIVAAFLLAYSGLTALSQAMDRHHRQVQSRPSSRPIAARFRLAGWVLLMMSLLSCVLDFSGSIGLVSWFGALTGAALVLVFLLPYAPRVAGGLALAAPVIASIVVLNV